MSGTYKQAWICAALPFSKTEEGKCYQQKQKKLLSGHELYATEEEKKSPYVFPIKGDFTGFPRLQTSL